MLLTLKKARRLEVFCRSWTIYPQINCLENIYVKKKITDGNPNKKSETSSAFDPHKSKVNLPSTGLDFLGLKVHKVDNSAVNIYVNKLPSQ